MKCFVVVALLLIGGTTASAQTEETGTNSDHDGFFMIGAGIGIPSGVSLIGGYDFGPIALRVSGGGWAKGWYGVEGDVAIHFNRRGSFAHGVSIVGGRFGTNPANNQGMQEFKTQNFIGAAYDVSLSGFILQAGLAFGQGDYPSPDAVYQVGYLFEF